MNSRRGRDIQKQDIPIESMSVSEAKKVVQANSGLQVLEDYISRFTWDRIPPPLLEALSKIKNAKSIDELNEMKNHPYQLVRDAVNDEVLIREGRYPNSQVRTDQEFVVDWRPRLLSAQVPILQPEDNRYSPKGHGLMRSAGRLAGTVHYSYPRFEHHLSKNQMEEGVVQQASPDRSYPITDQEHYPELP